MPNIYLVVLLCVFCTAKCFGEVSTPATFKNGIESPSAKIKFPKALSEGEHIYLCAGYTSSQGGLYAISCQHRSPLVRQDKLAIRAIQKGLRQVRLIPASIGEKRQRVWFNFAVIFERKGDVKKIYAFENHLLDASKYRREYTGPQRILTSVTSTCAKYMMLGVVVHGDGTIDSSEIVSSKKQETQSCQKRLLTLMLNSTYIPATHGGKKVDAQYREIFI